MSILTEIKSKRSKLITDAQALLLKPTTETRSQFDAMMVDVDLLETDIARLERVEKFEAETRTVRFPRAQPGTGLETDETRTAEKRAFAQYLRTGFMDTTILRENRDLSTGNTSAVIPQDFMGSLIEAQKAWGQLTAAVGQKRTVNGEPLKVAQVNDVMQISSVIAEGTPVVESDPTFSGFISNVDFLTTGVIKVSLAEISDSYFDLDSFIKNSFGKRIARGLSSLIVSGSTSGNIQSIVTTATTGATSLAPATLSYQDFVALYAKLDPAYLGTASWVFNNTTRGLLLGILDSFGRPLFVPSVNTDSLDTILGKPVVISQYHANVAATNIAVQFGSLTDAYQLRTAGDVSVLRLNERYADQGQVGFIGYHRNAGFATPAGVAPLLNLVQHA